MVTGKNNTSIVTTIVERQTTGYTTGATDTFACSTAYCSSNVDSTCTSSGTFYSVAARNSKTQRQVCDAIVIATSIIMASIKASRTRSVCWLCWQRV
jgi:hypothetical protein